MSERFKDALQHVKLCVNANSQLRSPLVRRGIHRRKSAEAAPA